MMMKISITLNEALRADILEKYRREFQKIPVKGINSKEIR